LLPYLLCIDFETTGLDIREGKHQPISVGALAVKSDTLEIVDKVYIECKAELQRFEWDPGAERIHGLSPEHLDTQPDMKEAATALFAFIVKHFKSGDAITIIGHNPQFDAGCLLLWMKEIGINLRLSHRKIDTFSIGFALFAAENSNQLFELVGVKRNAHNALEDAEATVAALQFARKVGQVYQALKEEAAA
jgi:DNA polymerase III epsilon subunit-like protein